MRTVSFAMNISLDGYCDHTVFSPEEPLMDYFTATMDDVDLLFYGRVMYELMFPYWADVARDQSGTPEENRFAERLTAIDKIVVSRTLDHAGDRTRMVRSNPVEALRELKQQSGGTISVDTVSMLPELINAGLIDEFHLVVHPIIAGRGRLLFNPGDLNEVLKLKLVGTIQFPKGCMAHHYRRG